ncbi:hypothetical protein ACLOJK_030855 [Asimina triloba]
MAATLQLPTGEQSAPTIRTTATLRPQSCRRHAESTGPATRKRKKLFFFLCSGETHRCLPCALKPHASTVSYLHGCRHRICPKPVSSPFRQNPRLPSPVEKTTNRRCPQLLPTAIFSESGQNPPENPSNPALKAHSGVRSSRSSSSAPTSKKSTSLAAMATAFVSSTNPTIPAVDQATGLSQHESRRRRAAASCHRSLSISDAS